MNDPRISRSPSTSAAGGRLAVLPPPVGRPAARPTYLTTFVGRRQEVAAVGQLLTTTRLLTLTGPGGCGKTRLAAAVVEDAAAPDGVCWVALAALADPALVAPVVADALGVREQPGRPLIETLALALQPRPLLLVLDNCEHLADACAALAEALLAACPALTLLATSRQVLGVAGELAWSAPPLSLPAPQPDLSLAALASSEAVQLFVARASLVQPGFTLADQNAAAVAQLCRRLDGLPLAIELAAARLNVLSAAQMAARLDDRFQLLTSGARVALPRHQTLRATVDWSYNLLTEPERQLFDRLAVFAGGWTLEAAEAVCEEAGRPGSEEAGKQGSREAASSPPPRLPSSPFVLDLLARLVDRSLVMVAPGAEGTMRYSLLETLRQYGWEQLTASGEAEAIQRRHADYYLALAETAESHLDGPINGIWANQLAREHDNLRAALRWAEASAEVETSLRLAGVLTGFWWHFGYLSEGRSRLTAALARIGDASAIATATGAMAHARALTGAGWLAVGQGDFPVARALLADGLARWRATDHQPGIAHACYCLGMAAVLQGDYAPAAPLLEEGLARWRALGHRPGMAWTLEGLAYLTGFQGDLAATGVHLEAGLAAAGDEASSARARLLIDLGQLAVLRADLAAARSRLAAGLALAADLRDVWGLLLGLDGWAMLAAAEGRPERALRLAAAAASLQETAGALLPGAYEALREGMLAPARSALGEAAGVAAWAAGRALSLDRAVAEALGQAAPPAGLPARAAESGEIDPLTRRENEVLRLIAAGKSSREIAETLNLSVRTVERHTATIYAKLEVHNRAEATAYAFRRRLV